MGSREDRAARGRRGDGGCRVSALSAEEFAHAIVGLTRTQPKMVHAFIATQMAGRDMYAGLQDLMAVTELLASWVAVGDEHDE